MYKKEPKEPVFCSGQLEPTWRGSVAGGVLIYMHIGGCGFESRCARAIFLLAFGALGGKSQRAQKGELCAAALAKVASLGVGRRSLIFRFFRCVFCGLSCSATAGVKNMDFGHVAPAGPQNGLRSEKCLFWHRRRSQQTHSHASSKRDLHANSA